MMWKNIDNKMMMIYYDNKIMIMTWMKVNVEMVMVI
jgi:hypothetical protein